jgi:PAS domain S-box-containing protein
MTVHPARGLKFRAQAVEDRSTAAAFQATGRTLAGRSPMPPIPAPTAADERLARALPWLVLLVGFLVAAAGARWLQDDLRADAEAEFRHGLARVSAEIGERFHWPRHGLSGATGLGVSHDDAHRVPLEPAAAARVVSERLADLAIPGAGDLHVRLFDSASGTPTGTLLFDSAAGVGAAQARESPRHRVVSVLALPGRRVTVELLSTPAFEARTASRAPERFAAGVVGAALLLALLLRRQHSGRRRAEALVRRMAADLERLERVARHPSIAVVFTDDERRITWVNGGFARITGYGAAEVVGRSPGSLLQTHETNPATVRRLRAALDAGQGFSGEIFDRGKDGRMYGLALDIQPLHDGAGVLTGFLAVGLDITERTRTAEAPRRLRERLRTLGAGAVAARPGVEPARPAVAGRTRRLDGLRLLVAEDEVDQQQVARRLLEDEGAEVHIADDGAEAVCAVATADPPFDGVLMDLQMPVMDGFTAVARIRHDLGLATLPIVAVTARAMAGDREACLASGMSGPLGKPFDPEQLVATLHRLAGRVLKPAVHAAPEPARRDADRPGVASPAS